MSYGQATSTSATAKHGPKPYLIQRRSNVQAIALLPSQATTVQGDLSIYLYM